jgi:hypothetical protein
LGPVDIEHDLKFFFNVFNFSLKDALRIDVKKWDMQF